MGNPEYEAITTARPVIVEHDTNVTRIIVAMHGLYLSVPRWIRDADMLALIFIPLWCALVLVFRTCLRLPNPPRAVFEINSTHLKATMHNRAGDVTSFDWPRAQIVELRSNRFEPGFWINIAGYVKETYLHDLPSTTLEQLEKELGILLGLVTAQTGSAATSSATGHR